MLFNMDEKFEIASGRHGGKRNSLLFLLCCNPALRRVRKAVCNYWANTDLMNGTPDLFTRKSASLY